VRFIETVDSFFGAKNTYYAALNNHDTKAPKDNNPVSKVV
jgi:hypothetical protein